jgi:hypothetical protein
MFNIPNREVMDIFVSKLPSKSLCIRHCRRFTLKLRTTEGFVTKVLQRTEARAGPRDRSRNRSGTLLRAYGGRSLDG